MCVTGTFLNFSFTNWPLVLNVSPWVTLNTWSTCSFSDNEDSTNKKSLDEVKLMEVNGVQHAQCFACSTLWRVIIGKVVGHNVCVGEQISVRVHTYWEGLKTDVDKVFVTNSRTLFSPLASCRIADIQPAGSTPVCPIFVATAMLILPFTVCVCIRPVYPHGNRHHLMSFL